MQHCVSQKRKMLSGSLPPNFTAAFCFFPGWRKRLGYYLYLLIYHASRFYFLIRALQISQMSYSSSLQPPEGTPAASPTTRNTGVTRECIQTCAAGPAGLPALTRAAQCCLPLARLLWGSVLGKTLLHRFLKSRGLFEPPLGTYRFCLQHAT